MGAGTSRRNIKAITSNIAAVFEQLGAPNTVSSVLTELRSPERNEIVASLILDGILEIEIEKVFVSQCEAYHAIVENDNNIGGSGRLANLSVDALKHGQRLGISDPAMLAARLYFYHRMPVTSGWKRLWPDANAVLRYLGAAPGGALRHDLSACFEITSQSGNVPWLSWSLRRHRTGDSGVRNWFKLYVSPAPQHTREAFAEVVALLPGSTALSLKIGSNAHGLLRPDKLVVYFDRHDGLLAFAESLLRRIAGQTAHGVPFSAPIDDAGILSWGSDPPPGEGGIGWYADDSWRIWICNRLALALIAAIDCPNIEVTPWRYALAKLTLSGVETRTWTLQVKGGLESGNPIGKHL